MNRITSHGMEAILAWAFVFSVLLLLVSPFPAFARSVPGHLMGIAGAALTALTLAYPFRKRIQGKPGRDNPIGHHILFGLAGPTLAMLHASSEQNSLVGSLTFLCLLLLVFSGLVGKFLFRRVSRTLRDQEAGLEVLLREFRRVRDDPALKRACAHLAPIGGANPRDVYPNGFPPEEPLVVRECGLLLDLARGIAEREESIKAFSATRKLFARWVRVHVTLAVIIWSLLLVHVANALYYGPEWLR